MRTKGRRRGGRLLRGGLALLAGGLAAGLLVARRRGANRDGAEGGARRGRDRWARPGMEVTFRAELMPGRESAERTFRVVELLPSGRVTLDGVAGEHTEHEFEPVR